MKVTARYGFWLLPLVLLMGCGHKVDQAQTQPLAPPIEDKPLPAPSNISAKDLPPPIVGDSKPATPPAPKPTPAAVPQKPIHHAKKPTPPQEAANTTAPSVSAIGQLSSGGSSDTRSETSDTIAATEKGLNSVTRQLSDAEQKTAEHIREFLKQAREALDSGDVDGAHTLADKAKVLLAELNR
jgi:outer membrane biosynthesis protein TonB